MIQNFKIALPLKLSQELTYSMNYEGNPNDLIGCRVLVKLQNKLITGIIINTDNENHSFEISPIIKLIEKKAIMPKTLINLCKWISKYYISELGIVIFTALPSSFMNQANTIVNKLDVNDRDVKLTPNNIKILDFLDKKKNGISVNYIKKNLKISNLKQSLEQLEKKGFIQLISKIENSNFVYEDYIQFNYNLFDDDFENEHFFKLYKLRSEKDKKVVEYFRENQNLFNTPIINSKIKEITGITSVGIKRLKDKGLIEIVKIKRDRSLITYKDEYQVTNELNYKLNSEQEIAFEKVMDKIDGEKGTILLNAVTGAGKTLVYMYLIREVLEKGKSCLLLVPEIALTNNLFDRFESAFPNQVSIYHSKMSSGSKFDLWHKVQNEGGQFVIGTRSAIFLPFCDLDLIIIDEEHDNSYKQSDKKPRYNARDIAVVRSKMEDFTLLLASATPSLESYYNAKKGQYLGLEIKKRADNAVMPKVRVVDMMDAKIKAAVKGNLSRILFDKMLDRIARGEQVILFLNRRGYSSFLMCRDCGDIRKCKNCDVALTYHKKKNQLYCHYCGYNTQVNHNCNECGSESLSSMGLGTEQIEEEINTYFNSVGMEVKVKRLDSDSAKNENEIKKIINDFQNNKFQILVGTQILAKGLNFKNVTLVGIVNSDLELYRADFRANEKTFQLLEQVAGRAGRTKELPGEVIIQTYKPDNYAINYVREHNYKSFANEELEYRKTSEYPPYWRMNKIIITGQTEYQVKKTARLIYNEIYFKSNIIKIYEPIVPSISMLNTKYRQYIFIKSYKEKDKSGNALRILYDLLKNIESNISSNIRIDIDIDTYSEG